jgi:hypothetical protein
VGDGAVPWGQTGGKTENKRHDLSDRPGVSRIVIEGCAIYCTIIRAELMREGISGRAFEFRTASDDLATEGQRPATKFKSY